MESFTCPYCNVIRPTMQVLRSHLEQNRLCRESKYNAYVAAESDDDDSGDSDDGREGTDAGDVGRDADIAIIPAPTAEEEVINFSDDEDGPEMSADPPRTDDSPVGSPLPAEPEAGSSRPRKRPPPTVEEVEDEDERYVDDFPADMKAGKIWGQRETYFETLRNEHKSAGNPPWYPFESEEEWELARWLMTSGLSQKKTDEYLKLKTVRNRIKPSFANNRAFLQFIDELPAGPQWYCHAFELEGDELDAEQQPKKETVEMWYRDPLECVKELLGNPSFAGKQGYKPIRVFRRLKDGVYSNQEFSEMWTAEWWWNIQKLLPPGSTLAPIIISTDKTQLTRFSGDKQAWPPLRAVGNNGVEMVCADGFVRKMFPILAAYIADYPEQCLVACCRENSCPRCLVKPKDRGLPVNSTLRDPGETLRVIIDQSQNKFPVQFVDQNLRPINPFWADFPHCDIFSCFTPDLLHELHNGVFGDHIVKWSTKAITGEDGEVDQRFRAMTPHPSLRHFAKGISLTSQWTGNERKNMEKVFVGILAHATDPAVQRAVAAITDFIYYAHFEIHCDESLARLEAAWAAFLENKSIFVELEIRKHFDINKLHKLKHYVDSIRSRGTADGFNTENTERLHIDFAKAGYRATNKVRYTRQMTVWLKRQEAVYKFGTYLQWAVPGYLADPSSASADDEADDPEGEPIATSPSQPPNDPDSDDEGELVASPSYRIAKNPPFPRVPVTTLVLEDFLKSQSIDPPIPPDENSTFPVYKRVSIPLPQIDEVSSHVVADTIRAVKGEAMQLTAKGVKPEKEGQFDTVLVHKNPPGNDLCPTEGLSVARIRVIFRLPENYGSYPHPLAYVDWYKPLKNPVPNIRMHEVSLSSRNHRQNSSIIPLTQVLRSCHLIPAFGKSVDPTWTSDRVLDQCKSFYLNPYLRHHDFYLFRYLVDLYDSRRAEEQRRVRRKQFGRAGG
ncbi:hypothetical protein DFH07DRAFT_753069 [Mycena maculata]|uniref:Uncharacterized protein n=1 Tax=Mycena maculata TaxID=230809 RepID=A0AAD7I9U2_9AGAR|nr:hypothetical protein DFH07DRAFT_753069 [Mycena maculata]